ncbi:MAG TPA: TonB-dependent receptor [Polyangiaceae bacterium]|nr:TonB-dependent receptor [Polyangiaceae bacterium]
MSVLNHSSFFTSALTAALLVSRSVAAQPAPEAAPAPEPAPTEVTVVGTRESQTAGSAHIVGKKQLERQEYDDPGAILQQVPGVYVRQEDGVGLRPNLGIRGANPDRSKKLTLMEDGILFGPAPYSAPAAYYFPLMTRMSAVRVIKGPAAVAYGPQTVGGAIDFISRPIPGSPAGVLDIGYGEYGYMKADGWFGASTERFGFLVGGTHLHNEGFKELPSGADTGATRNDWLVKGSYVVDPTAEEQNRFLLKLAYADEVSNETYLGLTDADLRADPDRRYPASQLDQMKNHRGSVVLFHEYDDPAARFKLKSAMYRHDYARIWRKLNSLSGTAIFDVLANPGDPANAGYLAVLRGEADSSTGGESLLVGPNDRAFVSEGLQTVLEHQRKTGPFEQRLELGTRFHHDEIRRRHSQTSFTMVEGDLIPEGTPEQVTTLNRESTYALALHAIDAITWRALTLTPGLRVELIHSQSEDRLALATTERALVAWMPGLGLYAALTRDFGLLAGVYRGFSPPPPGSGPEIAPEYSVNYEAGARFSRGPARVELIGFYNDYSNLTDICTLSSGCIDENLDRQFDAGQARIYGAEAFAAHELPISKAVKLPLSVAYTFTRAEFMSSFDSFDPIYGDVTEGDAIPYVPKHQLSATLGVEHDRASAYASFGYVSRLREEAGQAPLSQSLVTDRQIFLDAGLQLKVLGPLKLYGNLRNVLDERALVSRRPYGARPSPPRWLQVGAKVEL